MITLDPIEAPTRLVFRFPEVHEDAQLTVMFQRTLRIPTDGKVYPLPPGLGAFPLRHVEDFADRLTDRQTKRGGVMMPLHQSEAMWIRFECGSYPFAIKLAAGKINAITGELWSDGLNSRSQDYIVAPDQPWLDGFCVEKNLIRQFVAAPLGAGATVEEQLTGHGEFGGLQLCAYPMKRECYDRVISRRSISMPRFAAIECQDMGLAPGGLMFQQVFTDRYGANAWDQVHSSRCFLSILNSDAWKEVTHEFPPTLPPTIRDYNAAGLPWFSYFSGQPSLNGSATLGSVVPLSVD